MKYILIFSTALLCSTLRLYPGELHTAVQRNDINAVKRALATYPESINEADPASGGTPLLLAAMSGNIGIVELLIESGAEINLATKGVTPLHGAAYKGHNDIALYLVASGANMNARTLNGLTPADWAEKQGHANLVNSLKRAVSIKKEPIRVTIPAGQPEKRTSDTALTPRPEQVMPVQEATSDRTTALETLKSELAQSERDRIENEVIARANLEKLRKAKDTEIAELELIIVDIERALTDEKETSSKTQSLERRLTIMERRLQRSDERRIDVENRYKQNIAGIEAARDKAFAEFQDQIDKLKAAESALRADYVASRRETAQLKEELTKIGNELQAGVQRYEQLQKKYEAGIEAVQQSRDKAIADMNMELAEIRESEATLKIENIEKENQLAKLKEQLEQLRESVAEDFTTSYPGSDDYRDINALREEILALKTELDLARLEKEELLGNLEKTKTEHAELINKTSAIIRTMQRSPYAESPQFENEIQTGPEEVVELGSRIVRLALKMKETILTAESDTELATSSDNESAGQEFGTQISYRQEGTDGPITGFEAELVDMRSHERIPENEPKKQAPIPTSAKAGTDGAESGHTTPAHDIKGKTTTQTHSEKQPFACVMHVRSTVSGGGYSLLDLTDLADSKDIDAIFLGDDLADSIQYGFFPLRNIFWIAKLFPSVIKTGAEKYLDNIHRENARQNKILYIPGVTITPRFHWKGAFAKNNLVCANHERKIVALGTDDEDLLENIPIFHGFSKYRNPVVTAVTRLALAMFLLACLATALLTGPVARRAGCPSRKILSSFCKALVLPATFIMVLVNIGVALTGKFDIYNPDNPAKFEQQTLDILSKHNIPHFWAHPEITSYSEWNYSGLTFPMETRPYKELLALPGHAGFAGVNQEEKNELVAPGAEWDKLLQAFTDGVRNEAVKCFGAAAYNYEGHNGRKLGDIETMVWAEEKSQGALLDAIRAGHFYARQNDGNKKLTIETWSIETNDNITVTLAGSSIPQNEQVTVRIIKNGALLHESETTTPFEIKIDDTKENKAYYRALIEAPGSLRAVSNPIFKETQ